MEFSNVFLRCLNSHESSFAPWFGQGGIDILYGSFSLNVTQTTIAWLCLNLKQSHPMVVWIRLADPGQRWWGSDMEQRQIRIRWEASLWAGRRGLPGQRGWSFFSFLFFDLVVIIVIIVMVTWTEEARMPEQEVKTEMEQPPVQTYNTHIYVFIVSVKMNKDTNAGANLQFQPLWVIFLMLNL